MRKNTQVKRISKKVRILNFETKYTFEHPNPDWEVKGKKWITYFSLRKIGENDTIPVACILHVPLKIKHRFKAEDDILPRKCDLEEEPDAYNFYVNKNAFCLVGKVCGELGIVGSKKTSYFFPIRRESDSEVERPEEVDNEIKKDVDAILELLMIADVIYDTPEI
jgi:hypothetical protein